MKRSRFNEEQLIGISKEQAGGMPTAAVCRRHGISSATFYKLSAQPSFRAIFWEGGRVDGTIDDVLRVLPLKRQPALTAEHVVELTPEQAKFLKT